MALELILAVAAAAVAIFGTIADPGRHIKYILVIIAFVILAATAAKSFKDESDKNFVKQL